ncbi:MAG: hypothetical protein EAY75_02905 [Bacteroidetes bacterium]|nr:MAG: hypothetical protein EAY75_02905 [Bacteroidota bacterium]
MCTNTTHYQKPTNKQSTKPNSQPGQLRVRVPKGKMYDVGCGMSDVRFFDFLIFTNTLHKQ